LNICNPTKCAKNENHEYEEENELQDDALADMMSQLMSHAEMLPRVLLTKLRDLEQRLCINTRNIRKLGSRDTGFSLLQHPIVEDISVLKPSSTSTTAEPMHQKQRVDRNNDKQRWQEVTKKDLFSLSLQQVSR
jgi:hypothetical protein